MGSLDNSWLELEQSMVLLSRSSKETMEGIEHSSLPTDTKIELLEDSMKVVEAISNLLVTINRALAKELQKQ